MQKILIVDDDRDLSELIQAYLRSVGYSAFVAHSSAQGINLIREKQPNLILMDFILPGMSGPDLVKLLSLEPDTKDIPVIFLTGLLSAYDQKNGVYVNKKCYVAMSKPFETADLLKNIKELLLN